MVEVEILKLVLGWDSEDEIWPRFVFELAWTLVRRTQPSGPLCLWRCLKIQTQDLILIPNWKPSLILTFLQNWLWCWHLMLVLTGDRWYDGNVVVVNQPTTISQYPYVVHSTENRMQDKSPAELLNLKWERISQAR